MGQRLQGVIIGILIGSLLTGSMVFAQNYEAILSTFPIFINGVEWKTDKPVVTIDGSTYLPLRALGDSLGIKVEWNSELSRVEVGSNNTNSIEETDVILNEGSEWELQGKIAKQKDKKSDVAVVLVQGSGPSDMDETIFSNKPFYDIALGLAGQGIDVLRYDKRTYVYGKKIVESKDYKNFTVEQETIEDAIAAAKLLQAEGYKKIYLAGHSLGGMLAPRIEKESNGIFSGLILLAGSPRKLTDIVIDQNEAVISSLTDSKQVEEGRKAVAAEISKLNKLMDWNEEELFSNTVFGMPAYYLKDINSFDSIALAKEIKKPILVLQGDKDFQVYPNKDFVLWKEVLKDNEKAEFVLYQGFNHLFMKSGGEKAGTVEEYKITSKVEQKVIDDISSFIKKQK